MAEAPSSTSPTWPRKAVSVTFTMFCAKRLIIIGQEIFHIFLVVGVVEGIRERLGQDRKILRH